MTINCRPCLLHLWHYMVSSMALCHRLVIHIGLTEEIHEAKDACLPLALTNCCNRVLVPINVFGWRVQCLFQENNKNLVSAHTCTSWTTQALVQCTLTIYTRLTLLPCKVEIIKCQGFH